MVDHRGPGSDDARIEPRQDWTRAVYPAPEPKPLVSVIFPALDPEVLERACDGLFYDTDWPEDRLDVIVTDQGLSRTAPDLWNRLNRHPRVRMISVGSPDNISATFNQGVRVSGGDVVVLMDGVEPAASDWLSALVALAMRRDVGAVVAKVIGLTGCIALRREVLEDLHSLDKTLAPGLNDRDLGLRLQDLGYRIVWCPQALLRRTVRPRRR